MDATIAARLRAVAAAYDITILLPERPHFANNGVTPDTLRKIRQSDAVIALTTRSAQVASVDVVNQELATAQQERKPIIVLAEPGVEVKGVAESQIVRFDPFMPHQHEHALMEVVKQIQEQPRKKDLTALVWIAGIALGLIALSELLDDKK